MFARKHPFMFFTLVLSTIGAVFILTLTALLAFGASITSSALVKISETGSGNVGIVEITGPILSSKKTIDYIKQFRENPSIKAIVMRIDSPGGGVGPSQEIYREIVRTRQDKKVIASLGGVAASGGYYAASSCDVIMANPGTITGSIGVIMEYANFEEIARKIGLAPVVIKSGEFKDIGSPMRQIKDRERSLLQKVVDEIHGQFVRDAAKGRGMDEEDMASLADGRIYTGENAVSLRLVDRLGNLEDAVEWAGKLAGIEGKIKAVYPPRDKAVFLKKLIESVLKGINITGTFSDYFRYVIN